MPRFGPVSRSDGTTPRYTVGHLCRVVAIEEAMTAGPKVTLAGASYRGVGLPDCVTQAHAAAVRMEEWAGTHHLVPLKEPTPAG